MLISCDMYIVAAIFAQRYKLPNTMDFGFLGFQLEGFHEDRKEG